MEKEYGFLDGEEKEFVVLPKDSEEELKPANVKSSYNQESPEEFFSKAVDEMALSIEPVSYEQEEREEKTDEPSGAAMQLQIPDYEPQKPGAQNVEDESEGQDEDVGAGSSAREVDEVKKELLRLQDENRRLADIVNSMEHKLSIIGSDMAKTAESSRLMANQLETVNNNLHKENQTLKEGMYDSLLLPVLEDVIELSSDTMIDIQRYKKQGNEAAAKAMEDVLESIHLVLERHNVEIYQPQPGDAYDPMVQRLVKAVDTTDESQNKIIASCSGSGYRFLKKHKEKLFVLKDEGNDQVLSPCKVYVYKYNK